MIGMSNSVGCGSCSIKVLKYTSAPSDIKPNNTIAVVTSTDIPNSIYSSSTPSNNVVLGTVWVTGGNNSSYVVEITKKKIYVPITEACQWDGSSWNRIPCFVYLNGWKQTRIDLIVNGEFYNGFNLSTYGGSIAPTKSGNAQYIYGTDSNCGSTTPVYIESGRRIYVEMAGLGGTSSNSWLGNPVYITYSGSYYALSSTGINNISPSQITNVRNKPISTYTILAPESRNYYLNFGRQGTANTMYLHIYNVYVI